MNEEIKAGSVDTPEFAQKLVEYFAAQKDEHAAARKALVEHIDAWAINQLAASGAVVPSLMDEQMRAKFEAAWPEIHKHGIDNGWRGIAWAAWQSAIAATPVAGWVSVEDERKPELNQQLILFVRTVKYGESDSGRQFECEGSEIAMGEYRKYGDLEPQFDCYTSPMSDNDWVTHWMPLPTPPREKP